jgi:hypothetical protein
MTMEKREMHDGDRTGAAAHERLLELLADRAVFGLEDAEEAELAGLLRDHPGTDVESLDRLAATVAVAAGRTVDEAVPAGLRARLAADLRRRPAAARPDRWPVAAGIAVLATAASLLLLLGRGGDEPQRQPQAPVPAPVAATAAVQRDELLATVPDTVQLDCEAVADGGGQPAAGDVVWSPSRQRGFLRIGGLTPNEPATSRYQVWIIGGDGGTPVPGGTFDVAAGGEVVVPILPRGFVQGPRMFAVTLEPAGAVAESAFDRERVVVRAE